MAENARLSSKQQRGIAALLSTTTLRAAAEAAGVNEKTIYRWMEDEGFRQALREAEAEAMGAASRALLALVAQAIATIENVFWDATAPASVKLRAADAVLGRLIELRQQHDIEQRIAALEAAAQRGGQDESGASAASTATRARIDYRRALHDDGTP